MPSTAARCAALWAIVCLGCVDDTPPATEPVDAAPRDMRAVVLDLAIRDMAPDAAPDARPDAAPDAGCTPGRELCNGEDDDCDEAVDEEVEGAGCAFPLPGACAVGREACVAGELVCTQAIEPQDEICDEGDNDCDGAADEGLGGEACETGAPGVCGPGLMRCADGRMACAAFAEPGAEQCNGADDDCDAIIDEDDGTGRPCVGCRDGLPDIASRSACGAGGPDDQVALGECADETELYIVGQYESQAGRTRVTLIRFGVPIVLVLSSYEETVWQLAVDERVTLEQVIVNGYEPSVVEGLPDGVPLVDRTGVGNYIEACAYAWPGDDQGCDTQGLVRGAEALTGLSLTLFRGCYTGNDFQIVNDVP